jgi:cytosine/adenosine deaminase-related metal-dependent hydrolase
MSEEGYRLETTGYRTTTLRARYAFPVSAAPISDAAITFVSPVATAEFARAVPPLPVAGAGSGVRGQRIVWLGHSHEAPATTAPDTIDLGNAAILPGLINAHTHLEFSDLSHPLGQRGMCLPEWIRAVVVHRRSQTTADRRDAIAKGLQESARAGTTSLGEIATPGWPTELFFGNMAATNVPATTVFLELLGISAERTAANLAAASAHVGQAFQPDKHHKLSPQPSNVASANFVGLSPHAPYTVRPELVRHAAALSRANRIPLAMHLAESAEEIELLESGRGPLYDLLRDFGAWEEGAIPRVRPLFYLQLLAEAERSLVIHGTYLDDVEIAFIAAHAERMSVVYCPRTHAYFSHRPYPLAKLLGASVPVALGTDSRASNPDLSLFEEMRFLASRDDVAREKILELGTLGGARALGRAVEMGTLEPGKSADLTIIRLPDAETDHYELLFDPRAKVIATIRDGTIIAGCLPGAS